MTFLAFLVLFCCQRFKHHAVGVDTLVWTVMYNTTNTSSNGLEHEYGEKKAILFAHISIHNKLVYCQTNRLSCFICGASLSKTILPVGRQWSSRFSKLAAIRYVLTQHRRQRGRRNRVAYLDLDTIISAPLPTIFPSFNHSSVLMVRCRPLPNGVCTETGTVARYQTGVMFMRNDKKSRELFVDRVQKRLLITAEIHSDQMFINELLRDNRDTVVATIPKATYNAFPVLGRSPSSLVDVASIWRESGLPFGDETNESRIVHFAGVFGAASPQDGRADPLAMTISLREYTHRHVIFLRQVANLQKLRQERTSPDDAVAALCLSVDASLFLLAGVVDALDRCIDRVYRQVDVDQASSFAKACLSKTTTATRRLLLFDPVDYFSADRGKGYLSVSYD